MKKSRKTSPPNSASKSRKGYRSPKLTTHGSVGALTQKHGKMKPQCPGSAFDQRD